MKRKQYNSRVLMRGTRVRDKRERLRHRTGTVVSIETDLLWGRVAQVQWDGGGTQTCLVEDLRKVEVQ